MKIAASIALAGALISVALYTGLTDARRTYMKGCMATAVKFGQLPKDAENNCALRYMK